MSVIQNADGTQTVVALQDGNLITGTVQDCTPILDHAKAMHNAGLHGSSEMKLAASIPFVVIEKYLNDNRLLMSEFCSDPAHQRALLNDPSLSYFRVWPGRV